MWIQNSSWRDSSTNSSTPYIHQLREGEQNGSGIRTRKSRLPFCSRDFSARDSCKHPRSIFLCLTNLLKKRKRIQRQENGSILSRTPSWTPATKTTSVPAKTGKRTRAKPFGHIDVDHHETNDRANQQPRKKLLGQSDTNEDCSASG